MIRVHEIGNVGLEINHDPPGFLIVYSWTIPGFFALDENVNCWYSSPFFTWQGTYCLFAIHPNGVVWNEGDIHVGMLSTGTIRRSTNIKIFFGPTEYLDSVEGRENVLLEITMPADCRWRVSPFPVMQRSELLRRRAELVPGGILTISAGIRVAPEPGLGYEIRVENEIGNVGLEIKHDSPGCILTVFPWTIPDFFALDENVNSWYVSPPFRWQGTGCHFVIHPNGVDGSEGDIHLGILTTGTVRSSTNIKIFFRPPEYFNRVEEREEALLELTKPADCIWRGTTFSVMQRSELLRRRDELAPGAVLTISAGIKSTLWVAPEPDGQNSAASQNGTTSQNGATSQNGTETAASGRN